MRTSGDVIFDVLERKIREAQQRHATGDGVDGDAAWLAMGRGLQRVRDDVELEVAFGPQLCQTRRVA